MKKLIILAILLVLFILTTYPTENILDKDGVRHFNKMIDNCEAVEWGSCENYPPLYHLFGGLIVNTEIDFFILNTILMFFIIPIGLSLISGKPRLGLFFLLFTNIPTLTLAWGSYPSALIILFWIGFVFQKDLRMKALMFILGALTHNAGIALFSVTIFGWLLKEAYSNLKEQGYLFAVPTIPVSFDISQFLTHPEWHFNSYLTSVFPATLVIGLIEIIKQKRIEYLLVGAIALIWSLQSYRTYFILVIIALIGFTDFYARQTKPVQKAIIAFGILNVMFNYYFTWF